MPLTSQILSPEDRYERDRDRAIEAEYQAMLDKPLRCWIDETPFMRLADACYYTLPLGAEARRHVARIDLEAIVRAIAENRAVAFAEQCRTDHATGADL
jgi:hypothetical protein